jgi:hypothetical protein
MQEMVGGDYFRTPVKIREYDNLVFVGVINGFVKCLFGLFLQIILKVIAFDVFTVLVVLKALIFYRYNRYLQLFRICASAVFALFIPWQGKSAPSDYRPSGFQQPRHETRQE